MDSKPFQNFTELEVWKKARTLKNEIKELTNSFPADEKYRIVDQIIRSSRSVTATIAEGHGRFSYKDQIHFCIMARGSLSETLNHIVDAFNCGYIDREICQNFAAKIEEIQKLLNGYISFLKKNINTK
jgi:four helix bundle protein